MIFRQPEHNFSDAARQRVIRTHAAWLSRALHYPEQYPRIPVRPVAEGGFARLMSNRLGRTMASQWWESALEPTG